MGLADVAGLALGEVSVLVEGVVPLSVVDIAADLEVEKPSSVDWLGS